MIKKWLHRLLYAALALTLLSVAGAWLIYRQLDRTPSELLRYTERRLIGHNKLESLASPFIQTLRRQIERPINTSNPLPSLGKGALPTSLPQQRYAADGNPLPGEPSLEETANSRLSVATHHVSNETELRLAIANAQAGAIITLAPGTYPKLNTIKTTKAGTSLQSIVVRAQTPGSVKIEFNATEGFQVAHPYWIFENLHIKGVCVSDSDCEHAFHIYGAAKSTVIRNNKIEDFNAHLKINGLNNQWPDNGLVQYNTLTNTRRRETHLPVTPIDLVGAHRWIIADNIISNFVKGDGNLVAYGVFMKGASQQGRIERNLVVCTDKNISQAGFRVGISMGGGGTGRDSCRDKRCDTEHSQGIVANNIVAHCNDFGIDVNRSNQTLIAHNTLINTSGIDVRQNISSAIIHGNLFEGRIRSRDGALIDQNQNVQLNSSSDFIDADQLNLSWRNIPRQVKKHEAIKSDFCLRTRQDLTLPGALSVQEDCRLLGQK